MQTYMFKNDNSVELTESTGAIVEKSNSINAIRFVVPKNYEGFNMAEFDGLFEWKLPISNEANLVQLELADDNYKEDYLLYVLPGTTATTAITKECGEVEFSLTFVKADTDISGNVIERVRQSNGRNFIKIVPIVTFLSPSEAQLSSLAELYLANKRIALALTELANQLTESKIDDIRIDLENEKLVGTANGQDVGNGVDLAALNQELVLLGGSSADNGNISIQRI